jgi:hypothetical protein
MAVGLKRILASTSGARRTWPLAIALVVDAVRCAVEVQRGMVERNLDTPPERRIEFRVGINLGDIIVEGDDIFGDGVNVAAGSSAERGTIPFPVEPKYGLANGSTAMDGLLRR